MAVPTSREEFSDYILRRLGAPVIKINVADEQLDDRIDEALFKFYERHFNGFEEEFLLWPLSNLDAERGFIILPDDVLGVSNVFRPSPVGGIWDWEYQWQMNDLYSFSSIQRYADITYYVMNQSNLTLVNYFFAPDRQFTFNNISKKLIIAGGLKNALLVDGGIIIRCYRKIYGTSPVVDSSEPNPSTFNIWSERWLQNYAEALVQQQWGKNLIKFNGVQMVGGVQLNGAEILASANQAVDDLEQDLEDAYELPPAGFFG